MNIFLMGIQYFEVLKPLHAIVVELKWSIMGLTGRDRTQLPDYFTLHCKSGFNDLELIFGKIVPLCTHTFR